VPATTSFPLPPSILLQPSNTSTISSTEALPPIELHPATLDWLNYIDINVIEHEITPFFRHSDLPVVQACQDLIAAARPRSILDSKAILMHNRQY
jgi:hypothetical protein